MTARLQAMMDGLYVGNVNGGEKLDWTLCIEEHQTKPFRDKEKKKKLL